MITFGIPGYCTLDEWDFVQVFLQHAYTEHLQMRLVLASIHLIYTLYLRLDDYKRVFGTIVFPQHNLPLLLGARMLHPHLLRHLGRKLADEARVPELRSDTQVFTASHQGVGFAAFGCGGDAVRVEVLLLAAGYGDEAVTHVLVIFHRQIMSRVQGGSCDVPALDNKPIFPRD